jgi:hypothetical protein
MSHVEEFAELRVCIDRRPVPRNAGSRLALVKGVLWTAGIDIRVHFLEGDANLRSRVATVAEEWTRYANLHFLFGASVDAEVRVGFTPGGSWSRLGTDALRSPKGQPTMNLGWLNATSSDEELRRVVLHEFGHVLGCIHEHQNPAGGIHWNRAAVYAYYRSPPNNWDQMTVDQNIFATYSEDLTSHGRVDTASIMMYPIPSAFTENGFSVGLNTDLSEEDKRFIGEMYRR